MIAPPKYKVEAFDAMHFFMNDVHKSLIHCIVNFSNHIDEDILKQAISISTKTVPLIKCSFDHKSKPPYWRDNGYLGEDMVSIFMANELSKIKKNALLSEPIDIINGPQLKVSILRYTDYDSAYITINHMICDGVGFKEYLYLVSSIYSGIKLHESSPLLRKTNNRSLRQVYASLPLLKRLSIVSLKQDLSIQQKQTPLKFSGQNVIEIYETATLNKEEIDSIKAYSTRICVTLNDVFMAAYIISVYKHTGNDRVILPCPVDLRKYLKFRTNTGICNLSATYLCDMKLNDKNTFENIAVQVNKQMKVQKSNLNCLKSLLTLSFWYHLLPFNMMRKEFLKSYTVPAIAYSNIGILDKNQFQFKNSVIRSAYITVAIKPSPYFQISVSSYDDTSTLSSNLYGTNDDQNYIRNILSDIKNIMISQNA